MIKTYRLLCIFTFVPMVLAALLDVAPALSSFAQLRFASLFLGTVLLAVSTPKLNGHGPFIKLIWFFALAGIISSIWSEALHITLPRAILNAVVAFSLGIFYATQAIQVHVYATELYMKMMSFVLLTLSVLAYLYSGANAYHQGAFIGFFSNSNSLALLVLIFCAPLSFYYANFTGSKRWLGLFLLALTILIIVLTRSRSALVALIIMTIIWAKLQNNKFSRWVFIFSIIAIFVIGWGTLYSTFVGKYENIGISSFGTRMILWQLHYDAILEKPLFGYGLGVNPVNFKNTANFLYDTEKGSSYITPLEEFGVLISILFYLFFFSTIIKLLLHAAKGVKDVNNAYMIIPLLIIPGSLVHGLFESWIFTFGNPATLMFWLNIALLSRFKYNPNGRCKTR